MAHELQTHFPNGANDHGHAHDANGDVLLRQVESTLGLHT
jgi:hypothetical protein